MNETVDPKPTPTVPQFEIGDRVILRKPHPCGSTEWVVYRIGADIGLRCVGCDRRVMLVRSDLLKRMKQRITTSPPLLNDDTPSKEQ